ncbi:hypothetical protein F5148DRAFT_1237872 [Russula earlei]|uniref:Uncharacterized protein n=1 Tax=Russula earlei TaxID=71964 RepID=A0ACC0TY32_9AGAM|nr:hypothetical protein F5148DRAFT_1237872 [Russula earlei]
MQPVAAAHMHGLVLADWTTCNMALREYPDPWRPLSQCTVSDVITQLESNSTLCHDSGVMQGFGQRPPSLLYGGFGDFMDVFNCPDDALNVDARHNDLEMSVDSFAKPMTAFYRNEANRKSRKKLCSIFSLHDGGCPKLIVAVIGSGCSDGHYHGPHGAASCIVEFENRARRRQVDTRG